MTALMIDLPLPPRSVSPNPRRNGNWRVKATGTKEYRQEVQLLALNAARAGHWQAPEKARVHLEFRTSRRGSLHDGRYRPLDIGNAIAAFKAGFDGMVKAGVLINDDSVHMELGTVTLTRSGAAGITAIIEPIT